MRFGLGFRVAEIAQSEDTSPAAIYSTMFRARHLESKTPQSEITPSADSLRT